MRITDPKVALLRSLDILDAVPDRRLGMLAPHVDEVLVEAGTVLIHQGQLNRHAYVIASGSVAVDVDGRRVATVVPGSIVGERSALERELANATVTTLEPTRLLAVDHRALLGTASEVDDFDAHLHALVAERDQAA